MCKITDNFLLCTCADIKFREPISYYFEHGSKEPVELPRENLPKLILIWTLKHASQNDRILFGEMRMRNRELDFDFDEEFIARHLNSRNCFDYDYNPNEGDELTFKTNEHQSGEIPFIFTNGKWIQGNHDTFNHTFREIASGVLKN